MVLLKLTCYYSLKHFEKKPDVAELAAFSLSVKDVTRPYVNDSDVQVSWNVFLTGWNFKECLFLS